MSNTKVIFGQQKINGILTLPKIASNNEEKKFPAVLFLHGFGTDKNEIENIYSSASKYLSENGHITLRIDFSGYGDSPITSEKSTINTMIMDALAAFDYLCNHPQVEPHLMSVIGFSTGAAIAAILSEQRSCKGLCLVSPALNLLNDFTIFLGEKNIQQIAHCDNYRDIQLPWREIKIGKNFYTSLVEHQHTALAAIKKYKGKLYCVAGTRDFSHNNILTIENSSNSCIPKYIHIEDGDHIFNLSNGISKLNTIFSDSCSWICSNITSSEENLLSNNENFSCRL